MLDVKDGLFEVKFNEVSRGLLTKFESKQITEAEFDIEIAYMMLDVGIQHMRFRHNPPTPTAVLDYERKCQTQPGFTVSQEFWKQPDVRAWSEATVHNNCENYGNIYWLNWLSKTVPKGDVPKHKLINEVRSTYERKGVRKT